MRKKFSSLGKKNPILFYFPFFLNVPREGKTREVSVGEWVLSGKSYIVERVDCWFPLSVSGSLFPLFSFVFSELECVCGKGIFYMVICPLDFART